MGAKHPGKICHKGCAVEELVQGSPSQVNGARFRVQPRLRAWAVIAH